jgi:hypothetical protein
MARLLSVNIGLPRDVSWAGRESVYGSSPLSSCSLADGETDRRRVPMEREVVIAMANSPGVLDFYVWIAWKSWVLKAGCSFFPLFSWRSQRPTRMPDSSRGPIPSQEGYSVAPTASLVLAPRLRGPMITCELSVKEGLILGCSF